MKKTTTSPGCFPPARRDLYGLFGSGRQFSKQDVKKQSFVRLSDNFKAMTINRILYHNRKSNKKQNYKKKHSRHIFLCTVHIHTGLKVNKPKIVTINILWWNTILFKFQYTPPVPHSTLESRSGKNRLYFIP